MILAAPTRQVVAVVFTVALWFSASIGAASAGCPGFFDPYGDGCPTAGGPAPLLIGVGCPIQNAASQLIVRGHPPGAPAFLVVGAGHAGLPVNPWCILQVTDLYPPFLVPINLSGGADTTIPIFIPTLPAPEVYVQIVLLDMGTKGGVAATRALEINVGS